MVRLVFTLAAALGAAAPAFAWGAHGHETLTRLGVEATGPAVPAFLRERKALDAIQVLGRELDRSRGAGRTHGAERDPGHYVNVDDEGKIGGVLALTALPETRAEYNLKLAEAGFDQYRFGYLPYAMVDGWQQLVKDFAYWRAAGVAMKNAKSAADRRWFRQDRALREMLTIRDLGVWAHYVGDASQPLHVTTRFDGWGQGPNPQGFYAGRGVHARFEGAFVRANITPAMVLARMAPFSPCECTIHARVARYLTASHGEILPLYALDKAGGFPWPQGVALAPGAPNPPTPASPPDAETLEAGKAFAAQRLAAGASELRDLVELAWIESANASVGYPAVAVADIESGKVVLTRESFGND